MSEQTIDSATNSKPASDAASKRTRKPAKKAKATKNASGGKKAAGKPEADRANVAVSVLTTKGIISTAFTPLLGMSEVVSSFLEPGNDESRRSKVCGAGRMEGRSASR